MNPQQRPRLVRDADWPEILRLERSEYSADAFTIHFVRMIPVLHATSCWVIGEGNLLGYCLAVKSDSELATAWLLAVVVDAGHRRQGLGSSLVHTCVDALLEDGIRNVRLTVEEDNLQVRHIYEILGFSDVGLRPGFFGANGDRLEMALRVESSIQPGT